MTNDFEALTTEELYLLHHEVAAVLRNKTTISDQGRGEGASAASRAAHLMSGRQEAVTGVRDTVTAPLAAQGPG